MKSGIAAAALTTALAAPPGVAYADAATFRVEPELTSAGFAVTHLGIAKQRGRFDRTWGTIVLDVRQRSGRIDLIIDPGSVNTGWNLRDAFLRSEDMLDSDRFPALRFRSTRLEFDDTRLVAVDGEITLRGVTLPVRFEVLRVECGTNPDGGREGCGASVIGHISRSAFGMDYAYPLVGDDVELDFAVTAFRVADQGETETP